MGSEMCIRDSDTADAHAPSRHLSFITSLKKLEACHFLVILTTLVHPRLCVALIDPGLNSPEMAHATLALHVHALYIHKYHDSGVAIYMTTRTWSGR